MVGRAWGGELDLWSGQRMKMDLDEINWGLHNAWNDSNKVTVASRGLGAVARGRGWSGREGQPGVELIKINLTINLNN